MQSRPRAFEPNERKPGNPGAGPSALGTEPAWQSQAREETGCQARGQREKLQMPGVHASLHSQALSQMLPGAPQLSKHRPLLCAVREQTPPHSTPLLTRKQTMQPTSAPFPSLSRPCSRPHAASSSAHRDALEQPLHLLPFPETKLRGHS